MNTLTTTSGPTCLALRHPGSGYQNSTPCSPAGPMCRASISDSGLTTRNISDRYNSVNPKKRTRRVAVAFAIPWRVCSDTTILFFEKFLAYGVCDFFGFGISNGAPPLVLKADRVESVGTLVGARRPRPVGAGPVRHISTTLRGSCIGPAQGVRRGGQARSAAVGGGGQAVGPGQSGRPAPASSSIQRHSNGTRNERIYHVHPPQLPLIGIMFASKCSKSLHNSTIYLIIVSQDAE